MIPRHNGLVPVIRPAKPDTKRSHTDPAAKPIIRHYTILPLTSSSSCTAATEEVRLFTFSASADCPVLPEELQVAEQLFELPNGAAASEDKATRNGQDDDSDDAYDAEERNGALGSSNDGGHFSGMQQPRRRLQQRRRQREAEPLRLEYCGVIATAGATSSGLARKTVRLASTPAGEYSHLRCILLHFSPPLQKDDDGSATEEVPVATQVRAESLTQPILKLWGERDEAVQSTGVGISSRWNSEMTTRISKADWKTMDRVDAEAHAPRNWSDGDNDDHKSSDTVSSAVTGLTSEQKRRRDLLSRQDGTTAASFLAAARAALRQGIPASSSAMPPLSSPPAPPKGLAAGKRVISVRPVAVPPPPLPSTTSASLPRQSSAPPPPPPPDVAQNGTAASENELKLPFLAKEVLHQIHGVECRSEAPLMELQKRILKQLPSFAEMSAKMKGADTKAEAIKWFHASQQALKTWLLECGCTINPSGMVSFATLYLAE